MGYSKQNPLKRLVGEIHRRSLWQVLTIYLAGPGFLTFEERGEERWGERGS